MHKSVVTTFFNALLASTVRGRSSGMSLPKSEGVPRLPARPFMPFPQRPAPHSWDDLTESNCWRGLSVPRLLAKSERYRDSRRQVFKIAPGRGSIVTISWRTSWTTIRIIGRDRAGSPAIVR